MDLTGLQTLWLLLFTLLVLLFWKYHQKREKFSKYIDKLPGPRPWPIIGNALEFNTDHAELFKIALKYYEKWPRCFRCWIGPFAYCVFSKAEDVEVILSSNKLIDKAFEYDFFKPWLGTGLLISTGSKWQSRRKLLTPSFHFRILEDFIQVFNEQSEILVSKLAEKVNTPNTFDIFPFITSCTLDIICESVMGKSVNAQNDSSSEFVKATERIKDIIHERHIKLWYRPDWLFNMTNLAKEHQNCLDVLHRFTDKVIQDKKKVWKKMDKSKIATEESVVGQKVRLAFLDCLLDASDDGRVLNDMDIREEVDTFMFEGHDTTSVAICWALYCLGLNPECQQKVYEELKSVFGDDKTRKVTTQDLHQLKYLECVIKEALRLFSSVPMIARSVKEDININGLTIPSGSTIVLLPPLMHRNPDVFPDPEKFNPDRFNADNIRKNHPFAYIPFSAGPRNCIGQKFAMMEEKVILSHVLRNFSFESFLPWPELEVVIEIIFRPRKGFPVKIKHRK